MKGIIQACCSLVADKVTVVISKASSADTAIQADFLSDLHIPLITVSATDPFLDSAEREYLLRLLPSEKYLGKAIYDLTRFYNWPEVVIMATGNPYGINGVMDLDHLVQADPEMHLKELMILNPRDFSVDKHMKTIDETHAKIIIVHVDSHCKEIFEAANAYKLMQADRAWIVTEAIASQPEMLAEQSGQYLSYLDGILGIRQKLEKGTRYRELKERFLMAGNQEADLSFYTVNLYDAIGMVNYVLGSQIIVPYTQLDCMGTDAWKQGHDVLSAFRGVRYTGVVNEITFSLNSESREYEYEVVNFDKGKFVQVGYWSSVDGIKDMSNNVVFPGGVRTVPSGLIGSLLGTHLHLGTIVEEPFMLKGENCEGNDCWSGLIDDIVEKLSNDLGFTYDYLEPLEGSNTELGDGEWITIIEELLSGRTDMIAVHLSVNTERKVSIDFSFPFMDSGIHAIVKRAPGDNVFFFLEPFTFYVWFSMFMLNYVVSILIWFYNKISPFGKHGAKVHAVQTCACEKCAQHRADHTSRARPLQRTTEFACDTERVEDEEKYDQLSVYNANWTVITGLVGQTGESIPYSPSGRSLLFSWWAFTLLMLSLYTAELTAFLTISKINTDLDSLTGLKAESSKYNWGMIESRHPQMLLLHHNEKIYNDIAKEAQPLKDLSEAKEAFEEGHFVFIDEMPVLQHNFGSNCEAHFVGNMFQTFEYAFGLPKLSTYKSVTSTGRFKYQVIHPIAKLKILLLFLQSTPTYFSTHNYSKNAQRVKTKFKCGITSHTQIL